MRYVLLIHTAEARWASMSKSESEATMQAYGTFTNELFASGKAGDCAALEGTRTATSVRVRDGKRQVTDGPFAETREQLGGYYVVEGTEDEAIAWAAKIPGAALGTIEVRPVPDRPVPPPPPNAAALRDARTHKEYVLLIHENEAAFEAMDDERKQKAFGRYWAVRAALEEQGAFVAGAPLVSVRSAKSVRVDGGKRIVRDGPFAETREQLGGYYRIRARDLDEAMSVAAKLPAAETGTIEIRPVMDTSRYV